MADMAGRTPAETATALAAATGLLAGDSGDSEGPG